MSRFLLIGLFFITFASASNLLFSQVDLELLSSYSAIPPADFDANPDLYNDLPSTVEGSFGSAFIDGAERWIGDGYENFYAPYENVYPALVMYNTTDDTLEETSRVFCRKGVGLSNSVFSSNPDLKYGATSTYEPIVPNVAFAPHIFLLEFHEYDNQGILDQTPTVLDMSTLHPQFYNETISYNGFAGISNDGKYVIVTYAIGIGVPGVITGQKLEIIEKDTLTSKGIIDAAPTNIPSLYSFPQGCSMWEQKFNHGVYNMICAENSWNLTLPRGLTAQMVYYTFDSNTNIITRKDQSWVSQYIEGYDVDEKRNRVYSTTPQVDLPGEASSRQFPRLPYNNPAPDPGYEFRAWKIKEFQGNLDYLGGIELSADAFQVRVSNDGKTLATATSPTFFNDIYNSTNNPLSGVGRRFGANVLTLYRVFGFGNFVTLTQQSTSSVAPLSYGMDFTPDDSRLVVSGQPTYQELGGSAHGKKSVNLFKIQDN